jgi:release factor glutamine methyltransferase
VRAAHDTRGEAPVKKVTVLEALRLAERYLVERGIDSARLSAESLLARRMGCTRLDLYLRFDRELSEEVLEPYRGDLKRRATHYPLQYILGDVEFLSLPFRVSDGVFIPRPETELLVEWIEEILGGTDRVSFVEFGVGSGVISASLLARHPGWHGRAIDRSAEAVRLANENLRALGVADRIELAVADDLGVIGDEAGFDLFAANPPYVATGDIAALEPEVSRFEARGAIDGGSRGLDFYPMLAREARRLLAPGGLAAVEIGNGQAEAVLALCAAAGLERASMRKDYNGLERMVTAYAPAGREGAGG